MFHVWVGLGLLSGAGEAFVPVSPNAPDSTRRVGDAVLGADRRIGSITSAAAGARIGNPTARPSGRRIG